MDLDAARRARPEVRHFGDAQPVAGSRWILSGDFGWEVRADFMADEHQSGWSPMYWDEIPDLKRLVAAGAATVILAQSDLMHDTQELKSAAHYLGSQLGHKVTYASVNAPFEIQAFASAMAPGSLAIIGDQEYAALAEVFRRLGPSGAVIGRFSESHYPASSSRGLLQHLVGYLGTSQLERMETLKPWCSADRDGGFRVLVLSGSEKEDIEVLTTLGTHYDVIIPEGIVLSAILAVEQGSLQNSILAEDGKSLLGPVQEFLKTGRGKCCLPLEAIVARKTGNRFVDDQPIHFDRGDLVPSDMMVVSSRFPPGAESAMRKAAETGGRLLVAGMPDLRYALESASHRVAYWLDKIGKRALVLGGGAAASLMAERATISGGGGAAIQYLATGTTSVYEGLKRNMADFPV